MRRAIVTAALVAALACAPKNPPSIIPVPGNPPAAPPPPAPPPAAPQGLRLGPSALRYRMHQAIHIEQEFQGMRQPLDYGLRIFFAVTISGPADSAGYPTTITVDSIAPDSGTAAPMGINLGAAKALSFAGRLTPRGEFRRQVPSDSIAAQSLSHDRAAGSVTVTSISRSHAAAWEDRSGVRTMRVEVTSDFTIKGGGQQAGQPFEVAGAGVRSGVDYIAVDGRYMGGESHDSTSMTITLPIQAMTIPRTQVSKTTVTVLP